MSRPPQGKIQTKPELVDILAAQKLDAMKTINCVKIGSVESFDLERRTAEIQLAFKRVLPSGQVVSMPVLVDCPVFAPQGGGGSLTFPIAKGDQCIVLFADRNIDAWFQNGGQAAPFDARVHDLSDGLALVGVNYLGDTSVEYEADTTKLAYDGAVVAMTGGKVAVANATQSLLDILTALITAQQTLDTALAADPGLQAATQSAATAAATAAGNAITALGALLYTPA